MNRDPQALLGTWMYFKKMEEDAKAQRLEVEAMMNDLFPAPIEGQKTHNIADFRVTRVNKLYYKADLNRFDTLAASLPVPFDVSKRTYDETKIKKLSKVPELFEVVQDAITITPAKPSYEVLLRA